MSEELRLLAATRNFAYRGHSMALVFRWTRPNGHPGSCGLNCWHGSPEAALRCYRGRESTA